MTEATNREPASSRSTQGATPVADHVALPVKQLSTAGWIGVLLILMLLTEQSALSGALFAIALPSFGREFNTTEIVWMITLATLVGAVVTPLAGKLADIYGKKRVLIALATISTIGGCIGALAVSWPMALLGRALGGTALAFLPVGYSLIRDTFPEGLRPLAIAIATNGIGVLIIVAQFSAGFLIEAFGVRSVFWVMAIASGLGLALTALFVPESPIRARTRIDWLGAFLLAAAIGLLLYTLTSGQALGWTSGPILGMALVIVALIVCWVAWELRCAHPLVRIGLLSNGPLAATIGVMSAGILVQVAIGSVFPTMIVTSPTEGVGYGIGVPLKDVGYYTLLGGVMLVGTGFFVGSTAKLIGFRNHLIIGMISMVTAAFFISMFHSSPFEYILAFGLMGFGGGCILSAGPNMIMTVAPEAERAIAAATASTITLVFSTIGAQLMFGILGAYLLPQESGDVIYQEIGFRYGFMVIGTIALLGLMLAYSLPRAKRA